MNENILLVEDEEGLRMTLGDRLRSEGYVVDFASDGQEAFDKATQLPLAELPQFLSALLSFDQLRREAIP